MRRVLSHWLIPWFAVALCACGTTPSATPRAPVATSATNSVRDTLVGTWQYELNGVVVEVTYTPAAVTMPGVPPTPYTLVGNEITVDILGAKTSIIEFHGKDEMVQTNKTDGQRYVFKRKRAA